MRVHYKGATVQFLTLIPGYLKCLVRFDVQLDSQLISLSSFSFRGKPNFLLCTSVLSHIVMWPVTLAMHPSSYVNK